MVVFLYGFQPIQQPSLIFYEQSPQDILLIFSLLLLGPMMFLNAIQKWWKVLRTDRHNLKYGIPTEVIIVRQEQKLLDPAGIFNVCVQYREGEDEKYAWVKAFGSVSHQMGQSVVAFRDPLKGMSLEAHSTCSIWSES